VTRRILVFLTAVLFFILTGLLVLFFYLRYSGTYHSQAIKYVPQETSFILRLKKTSQNLNAVFSNEIITDNFQMDEISHVWKTIDSLTSRNYKTNEILNSTTSYFCIDSIGRLLVLIEMPAHTSEHFIDQFLVNSTSQKKLEKFKDGYKLVIAGKKPLYYFLNHDVFGISYEKDLVESSLKIKDRPANPEWTTWNTTNKNDITVWMRSRISSSGWFTSLVPLALLGNGLDSLGGSGDLNIEISKHVLTIEGDFYTDSLSSFSDNFYLGKSGPNYWPELPDSAIWENQYFSFQVSDTSGTMQPLQIFYTGFQDSSEYVELLISESAFASSILTRASVDSSVQVVPMADASIGKVVVLNGGLLKKLIPTLPFQSDTGSFFAGEVKGAVFFTRSMESILSFATIYPQERFKKNNLAENTGISSTRKIRLGAKLYLVSLQYRFTDKNKFHLTSEIKCVNCK